MTLHLIDTHAHLAAPDFDADRDAVLERAQAAGVKQIITIGAGWGVLSAIQAVQCAEAHAPVFASVGLHPNDAAVEAAAGELNELAQHPKVVAIGETGLDYYRKHASPDCQEKWFRRQIELALKVKKPLVIHSRQAGEQCLKILMEMGAAAVGGVFHCFAEDAHFAERLSEINFIISVPGSITFKKADNFRETIRQVPLENIMLETDAPFLAPEPYRGKRCESAYVVEIAKKIAELKGLDLESVASQATLNAQKLFRLPSAN